jgi:hypothetical protein
VARDPTNYEDISGPEALDDLEVESLRDEVLHKWRQPFALYMTIVICSIGAAVQGWDQTGTSTFCCGSCWYMSTSLLRWSHIGPNPELAETTKRPLREVKFEDAPVYFISGSQFRRCDSMLEWKASMKFSLP